jgi:DNA-binding GntR family transcriptional regulator
MSRIAVPAEARPAGCVPYQPTKSIGQAAHEKLLDMLMRREIPAGAVLHERRLAQLLKISRTPVREALGRLESAGFLMRRPRNILVVKELSTRELVEILHVRSVLEAEAATLATGRIRAADLDDLEDRIRALLDKPDPTAEEDWEVDSRFHGLIAEHGGNALMAGMIEDLRLKTHMFNLNRVPERFEIGHREHLAVIDALRREDRHAARSRIVDHLEKVKESIIRKLGQI